MSDEIRKLLSERAEEGRDGRKKRITCEEAWRVAEELGVPKIEVGNAANELDIRITDCQLGCFR